MLIRSIHSGPTLNDILPRLTRVKYPMLIDASSGYHNLKLDEKSSHLTTFPYPFGRYQYIKLPFGAATAGNIFQKKIDEFFNDISNVFGIADNILITRFDAEGRDHDVCLQQVLLR